ncbi:tripartite tricarboxylate transporter TctB family protein [Ramlibacter albus]|uniref:Tripartite tricarboxylate transporter TctB family protein n=1 Tax=Ramlibacter albus TaxID=2079448 RepID=A0A923MDZ0_9BURK|nr:tripartite tricarboxylate transporter TctB family protein [Ramlibacter albus]MBC5767679.1 tripartite tricarboxylate transporter TctB family protein [Ramlibacter albus]
MDATQQGGEEPRGIGTHTVELVVAALVAAFGLTVLIGSWNLGSKWTSDGPGPGYFPFYIGLILTVSGAGIFLQALRRRRTDVFVDNEQLKQVLTVLVPAALYIGAVQVFGVYIASAVYIAVFMAVLGKFAWPKSIVAAVIIMGLFFMMFEVWFKVPLFKGAVNLLSFTGY